MKRKRNIYDADDAAKSKRLHFSAEERAAHAEKKAEILGEKLERILGHAKYLIFYLMCGIAANLISMGVHQYLGEIVIGAGASGAIFGVIGGLVWAAARNRGRLQQLTSRQLGIILVIVLYYGFSSRNIDNWAHLGGLAAGILLCILMYRRPKAVRGA